MRCTAYKCNESKIIIILIKKIIILFIKILPRGNYFKRSGILQGEVGYIRHSKVFIKIPQVIATFQGIFLKGIIRYFN